MKFFTLIPSGTTFEFVKNRWKYLSVSLLLITLSIGAMIYNQVTYGSFLNFGIDFAGGSQVRLALHPDKDPGIDAIRAALVDAGYQSSSAVVVPEADHEVLVRVKDVLSIEESELEVCKDAVAKVGDATQIGFNHPEGGSKVFLKYDNEPSYREVEKLMNEAGCDGTADPGFGGREGNYPVDFSLIGMGLKISDEFNKTFGEGTVVEIVRSETVGAKVGDQLKTDGAKSMLYAIGFIFLFVMVRFDLRFAPGGIVALTHDALVVIGAFAITGKEFNLQTIAAVLTIIGYSINDTIVVFDRVRERVALYRDEPIEVTTNSALNDTLSRTILTSGTTLIVVLATYLLGSGPIKDFAFALIVGVLVGTYSSLCVATPVFLWVNNRFYAGRGHLRFLEDKEREGTGTLLGGEKKKEDPGAAADAQPESAAEAPGDDAPKKASRRRRRRRPQ